MKSKSRKDFDRYITLSGAALILIVLVFSTLAATPVSSTKTRGGFSSWTISFVQPLVGVDGDTSGWSNGNNMVNLGTDMWSLLNGTALVRGYTREMFCHTLTHRGTRGLGINGHESDEVDSYGRPEVIEISFNKPHYLNALQVRSLFSGEGPGGNHPEEGDVEFYLTNTLINTTHLVGVENIHTPGTKGIVNVTFSKEILVDKIIFWVKPDQPYTSYSEFAVAKLNVWEPPCPCTVWVDDDWNNQTDVEEYDPDLVWQYDAFNTIHDAVDAVCDCGTIHVLNGTYTEQILINKNISLRGINHPTILPPYNRTSYNISESTHTLDPIIFAYGGTLNNNNVTGNNTVSVEITGFKINGCNNASSNRFVAILYRNIQPGCHSSLISNNIIYNMYDSDGMGNGPETFGVLVYGNSSVTIENNLISDFSRGGIGANGDDDILSDPVVTIQNNTVLGNGLENQSGWWAENGVQIGYGAAGKVINNTIKNCQVNNTYWASTGILIYDAANGVNVSDNTVTKCDVGISVSSPSFDIINNNTVTHSTWEAIRLGWPTDNATITNNTLLHSTWGIGVWDASDNLIAYNYLRYNNYGMEINGDSHRNNILHNWFLDQPIAILVTEYAGTEPTNIEAHYNYIDTFCSMDIGVWNQVSVIVNATFNWWGGDDGPSSPSSGNTHDAVTGRVADGYGEQVIGLVHFDPWAGVEASANIQPTSVVAGDVIHFDASDSFSYHLDGTPNNLNYYWDLGNGQHTFSKTFGYVYTQPGVYTVVLKITAYDAEIGHDGTLLDFDTIKITVSEPTTPLQADADANNLNGYQGVVNNTIQFHGLATGGTPPYTYHWEFGDGETSEEQNPTHVYQSAGEYTVTLTVTDGEQNTDESRTQVVVIEQPPAGVEIKEIKGFLGVKATINNAETTPVEWEINITGGFILFGGHAAGTIPAETETTVSSGLIIGFGKINVEICAGNVCKEAEGLLFGPVVLNLKET
ncbi:MAG: PKD domain-containing protein [Thermoplasmata archaeon]|nr:PKD domain-containing protein [Thermoplasmata archaeon]